MPTILRVKGYRFFFFSNEMNEPTHIHIESAEKYAKFWLHPIALAKNIGFDSSELTEIRNVIMKNIKLMEERWNEYFSD
ncbi:MAG: DUF4160 domain-containing protein [candidate division WOR-3 bacterium]|nr:DUF4160 domain-containing protein [candidate division WOR-3 bacterium]